MTSIGAIGAELGQELDVLGQFYEGPNSIRASADYTNDTGVAANAISVDLPFTQTGNYALQAWVDVIMSRPGTGFWGARWQITFATYFSGVPYTGYVAPRDIVAQQPASGSISMTLAQNIINTSTGPKWVMSLASTSGFQASVNVDIYWQGSTSIPQVLL